TKAGLQVLCFSGRGGEQAEQGGRWRKISRDEVKRLFRAGTGDVLLCTDAAAEGLNFQFCGALVNYDMPWNPMRVEQRIGRIDRLGQKFETIRVVNLYYRNSVETDVYMALRERYGLFTKYVGRLQPILSALPREITDFVLADRRDEDRRRAELVDGIETRVREAQASGFDLDEATQANLETPERP